MHLLIVLLLCCQNLCFFLFRVCLSVLIYFILYLCSQPVQTYFCTFCNLYFNISSTFNLRHVHKTKWLWNAFGIEEKQQILIFTFNLQWYFVLYPFKSLTFLKSFREKWFLISLNMEIKYDIATSNFILHLLFSCLSCSVLG